MDGIEILPRLNQLLDERSVYEKNIETESEASGLDLGPNIKSRLNYLVSLGILRHPEPKYYGKGRGGTRLFQRDVMDVLYYVDDQKNNFSFNEISGIIRERRRDLTRKFYKELNVENYIQDPPVFVKACMSYADSRFLFKEDLLRANVMSITIGNTGEYMSELKAEIATLNSFQNDIGKTFCNEDHKNISNYIEQKNNHKNELEIIMEKAVSAAKKLVEKIESEDY